MTPSTIVARLRAAGCVFAEDEAALLTSAATDPDELEVMIGRRVAGHPIEHVVGWADFCDLRVAVDPGVFVPRRRTEPLAREAATLAGAYPGPVVLDLCCGCGAIGAVVATLVPGVRLVAADVDPAAARCARRNLEPFGARVYCGDLFTPLPASLRGTVRVLVANVPYVPSGEVPLMPAEARLFEPLTALDGGADGLDVLRRVAAEAPSWLAPGGHLLMETSARQTAAAGDVLAAAGFAVRRRVDDDTRSTTLVATNSP